MFASLPASGWAETGRSSTIPDDRTAAQALLEWIGATPERTSYVQLRFKKRWQLLPPSLPRQERAA